MDPSLAAAIQTVYLCRMLLFKSMQSESKVYWLKLTQHFVILKTRLDAFGSHMMRICFNLRFKIDFENQ